MTWRPVVALLVGVAAVVWIVSPGLAPRSAGKPAASRPSVVPAAAQPAVVERVVDGDTLWVRVDEPGGPLPARASHNVRLLIMDTPETVRPGADVECYGPQATRFARARLSPGNRVWLLGDRQDTDRYGRFLRYLWTDDGVFFNERSIRAGYAKAIVYTPNDAYASRLRAAEAEARADGRGLWSSCASSRPTSSRPPDRSAGGGRSFPSCADVEAAGAAPLSQSDLGYAPHLDGDGDGVACEP